MPHAGTVNPDSSLCVCVANNPPPTTTSSKPILLLYPSPPPLPFPPNSLSQGGMTHPKRGEEKRGEGRCNSVCAHTCVVSFLPRCRALHTPRRLRVRRTQLVFFFVFFCQANTHTQNFGISALPCTRVSLSLQRCFSTIQHNFSQSYSHLFNTLPTL